MESIDPAGGAYTQNAAFAPRHYVGDSALVGSQLVAVAGVTTEVSAYDPAADAWVALPPLVTPNGRFLFRTIAVQGLLLVLGGYDQATATARVDIFDPLANQWRTGADMPPGVRGSDRYAVAGGRVHVLSQRFNLIGPPPPTEHAAYDPLLDQWETLPPPPTDRYGGTWTSDGQTLYFIGGQTSFTNSGVTTVDRYDPTTRTWSGGIDLPAVEKEPLVLPVGPGDLVIVGKNNVLRLGPTGWRQINSPQASKVTGRGVVSGGQLFAYEEISTTQGQPISFDLTQETWQRLGLPPTNRVGPELFISQGRLYVALGFQFVRVQPRRP